VIAAINGHCVGGGLEIAMAADIRIARKDAGKIGLPGSQSWSLPGTGGNSAALRGWLARAKPFELMVTGTLFLLKEALELGIIKRYLRTAKLAGNIMEYARQFLPPNKVRRPLAGSSAQCRRGWEIPWSRALAVERENQQLLFQSEDAKEGLAAYVEKAASRV